MLTEKGYDFWRGLSVAELAQLQGVRPVQNPDDLKADFWPEEEVDAFVERVRQWREEGTQQD